MNTSTNNNKTGKEVIACLIAPFVLVGMAIAGFIVYFIADDIITDMKAQKLVDCGDGWYEIKPEKSDWIFNNGIIVLYNCEEK